MQDDAVVILQPDKPPSQYRFAPNRRLAPMPLSPELVPPAHAHALWGSLAYDKGWHRLER